MRETGGRANLGVMKSQDRGQALVGRAYFLCQITGWLALGASLYMFVRASGIFADPDAVTDPSLYGHSAAFLVAAALVFGLSLNAIARQ